MSHVRGMRNVPAGMPIEIVGDDNHMQDSVAAWLSLEQEEIQSSHGATLFSLGVPCRRRMVRPAVKRHVFVDGGSGQVGGDDTSWDSPLIDGPVSLDENHIAGSEAKVEEREISPAVFAYEAPRVLALLPPGMARWAYETFKAAEFDSMYRLRDDATPWSSYVEELRDGMEQSK